MELFRRRHRIDPNAIRLARYMLFRMHLPPCKVVQRVFSNLADRVREEFDLEPLRVVEATRSALDRSTKVVFSAADGARFESVLMSARTGRTTVCVSSQVGCAAGCPFCATASMKLQRNLGRDRILEEIRFAAEQTNREGRRLRNVVFMGMREPLVNEPALWSALEALTAEWGFAIQPGRITVSSLGVPAATRRRIDRFPSIQLAVSLHAARPEIRAKLIPWSRRHTWQELREALSYVADRQQHLTKPRSIMIQYMLLDGVNDARRDAIALIEYLRGIRSHVNLIPFNPIFQAPAWRASPLDRRNQFAAWLRAEGLFTTIRYSMVADLGAACGQLVAKSLRQPVLR